MHVEIQAHVFIAAGDRCRTCCSVQTHFVPIITVIVAHTTQVSMFDSIISNVCPLRYCYRNTGNNLKLLAPYYYSLLYCICTFLVNDFRFSYSVCFRTIKLRWTPLCCVSFSSNKISSNSSNQTGTDIRSSREGDESFPCLNIFIVRCATLCIIHSISLHFTDHRETAQKPRPCIGYAYVNHTDQLSWTWARARV